MSSVSMPRSFRSRAQISRMASPLMTRPFAPASMQRSASPSKVRPICAPRSVTSLGDAIGMKGAAVGVDVAAVGRDVEQGDAVCRREAAEKLGGDGGGGAVGAVGDNAEAGEARPGTESRGTGCSRPEGGVVFDRGQGGGIGRVAIWAAWRRISSSMASSTASGSLKPSAPKSLMPLSCQGLWDGGDDDAGVEAVLAGEEGDGRAWGRCRRFRPARLLGGRPAARVAAIQGLDSRVSRPRRTRARWRDLRSEWASARPAAKMVLGSSGDCRRRRECRRCRKSLRQSEEVMRIVSPDFLADVDSTREVNEPSARRVVS